MVGFSYMADTVSLGFSLYYKKKIKTLAEFLTQTDDLGITFTTLLEESVFYLFYLWFILCCCH
jgi:hypothetical protein